MAVVLPLLLILLLGYHCPCSHVAADEHGFTAAAACSGHSGAAAIPPRQGTRVVVPLYRHLSPCSPASSSSTGAAAKPAAAPSLAELLRQDQLRADHIHRTLSSSSSSSDEAVVGASKQAAGPLKEPVRSELIHLHNQPVIQVAIGSERKTSGGGSGDQPNQEAAGVVQTVVLDTASDVPWVQCHPSSSSSSSSSYDPARSGTYTAMACNSPACMELGRLYGGGCGAGNQCQYRVPVPMSSPSAAAASSGTYGSDLLALSAADTAAGAMSFKFGCSHAESSAAGELDNTTTAGVMALGGGTESLVSQTAANYGNAFSYCIPASDSRRSGFFVLGAGGGAAGYAVTPMLRYARVPTYYRVRMVGIAVDGERLNVTAAVFAAGAVLDSRTAVTRLPPTAYGALREAFRSRMALYAAAPPPEGSQQLDTCYDFSSGALFGFVMVPRITLIFDGHGDDAVEVEVELDRSGVLFHGCLAFMATSAGDDRMAGVIGNVQQQTMEVLYDVGAGSVGFRRGAC